MKTAFTVLLRLALPFFLAGSLWSQNQIWVDPMVAGPGAGTPASPYKSLTYAIAQQTPPQSATEFMIAGRGGAYSYSAPNETFPINIPAWARLEYWNASGIIPPSQPPAAKFVYPSSGGTTCFRFKSPAVVGIKSGINSYMNVYPLTLPDTNQGFEIWDFEYGISVDDAFQLGGGGNLDVVLDGIAFFDCKTALKVEVSNTSSSKLSVSNSLFRAASSATTWSVDQPLINVAFDGSGAQAATFDFTLQSSDLRPSDIATTSSIIVLQGLAGAGDDLLKVTLRNVKITGQAAPPYQPGSPPTSLAIGGMGIEAGLKAACRGRFSLENVSVRDALAGGLFGSAMGDDTFGSLATRNCSFRFNGASSNSGSFLAGQGWSSPVFLESGLHLVVREGASWEVNDARESFFNDNYRHGVFLDGRSEADEHDGFPLAEFDLCTFLRNGLELGADQGTAQGHGLLAELEESYINLLVHRSALSGNFSSGLKLMLLASETARVHNLEVTNSTLSQNKGLNPEFSSNGKFYDTNPLSVVSKHSGNGLEIYLSHVTISNNTTPYAVSLYGDPAVPGAQTSLWPDGSPSTVDNCVLNKNGFTGSIYSDQAFHPEPGPPPPALETQWDWIMKRTHHSNLGTDGAVFWTRYINGANANQVGVDPLLEAFSFMGNAIGVVFPQSASPLINAGGGARHASEATDNRGPGYPRLVNGFYDIGAFEIKAP
jgi:hypothetical protein